jgi:hypothetical protein
MKAQEKRKEKKLNNPGCPEVRKSRSSWSKAL